MSGFFAELRRRKVYRVAAAYAVVAWLIIQISATVFPAWEMPSWALRLVIVLVLSGFPIALIFAWVFDMTTGGIERTPKAEIPSDASFGRRRRNMILLLGCGLIISLAAGFFVLPRATARKLDKSIAVLPFENLSEEKANAHFADGIQDDVLTNLSKIGDLKVISRTSVMAYRGNKKNIREIGKALGVSTILEGSVRREGNRVRLNVQLINAETDQHIWAHKYERDLTDVFAIQTELANEIANSLQAKLSPSEKAQMERKPTENAEAYLLYVQARDLFTRPDRFAADLRKAVELFERAIELDPAFALAYAQLSHLQSWIFHSVDPSPQWREKARASADQALVLQPDLPEGHVALGYCYYYGDRDYTRALDEFAIAQRGLPNDAETRMAIAAIQRRQGKWKESTANFEKAASLNPKDVTVLQNLAINYAAVKNYEAAEKTYDRALKTAPNSFLLHGMKAKLALESRGDLSSVAGALARIPGGVDPDGLITLARVSVSILERKYQEALQVLQKWPQEILHSDSPSPMPKGFYEGMLYTYLGDAAKAESAFERGRVVAEKLVRENPEEAGRRAYLGGVLAGLGRKEEAINEGKRAMELLPESQDALDGPKMTIALAQIYTWIGEKDLALQLLERSLQSPAGMTVPILKLDPIWDNLRGDPRFQELIRKYDDAVRV